MFFIIGLTEVEANKAISESNPTQHAGNETGAEPASRESPWPYGNLLRYYSGKMSRAEKATQADDKERFYLSKASSTDKTVEPEILKLSLRDLVLLVRKKNEQIGIQNSEWIISREGIEGAKAIFEPSLVGSYTYGEDNRRNTIQEAVSQGLTAEFHQKSRDYGAAIESLVPTGGRLSVGYTVRDFSNNLQKNYGVDTEVVSAFSAELTQPLLKNAGVKTTTAAIRVAKADATIEFQNYRELTMRVLSEAIAAYWRLYLAQEKYKLRKESERKAQELLEVNLVRAKTGMMAQTEVFEARAGLEFRKSLVSEAKEEIDSSMNNVRTFFSSSAAESANQLEAVDRLELEQIQTKFHDSLEKAFKLRAEYLSVRKKIEREEIRLVFSKNQRWPQLDLKASYGLNGLSRDIEGSWSDVKGTEFPAWSVGLELRIPLGGDKKSRSELKAIRQRKRQALYELKAIEVAIANAVDTAIKRVHSARVQVGHYGNAVGMNERLLAAEVEKFRAGKSNSRILLEREQELIVAKESEIDSLVKHQQALLQLDLAEGALLIKFGIEMMEVDS